MKHCIFNLCLLYLKDLTDFCMVFNLCFSPEISFFYMMFFRSCHGRDRVGPYSLCDNTWLTDWPINPLSVGQYVNNHNKGKQDLGLQVLTSLYFFVSCGKFGSPYLGNAQQPQDQHYPFLSVCVTSSFV